jgi:hypothetical protein
MTDSYLFDASWLFFVAWSVIVLGVSWAAFAQDLLPGKRKTGTRQDRGNMH